MTHERCNACGVMGLCERYSIGGVRGQMCRACTAGAGAAMASWMLRALRAAKLRAEKAEADEQAIAQAAGALEAEMVPRLRRVK